MRFGAEKIFSQRVPRPPIRSTALQPWGGIAALLSRDGSRGMERAREVALDLG